jgi:predicted DNA-binding protein (MmcQ/YjbR family)
VTAAGFEAAIRRHALTLPEAYEDRPWGHPVFKLPPNRVFVFMSEGEDPVRVTVKLDAEEREAALTQSFISVAKYVGRYGWVTVEVIDDDVLTMVLDWVAESWWLKAGAAQRKLLEP